MLETSIFCSSYKVFYFIKDKFHDLNYRHIKFVVSNALNLDKSRILSFGKELVYTIFKETQFPFQSADQAYNQYYQAMFGMKAGFAMGPQYISAEVVSSCLAVHYPFSKQQILDSSKLKKFVDHDFNFDGNGRKFSKQVENTVGKGEIARYEQFLLFPQCFQKTLTTDM